MPVITFSLAIALPFLLAIKFLTTNPTPVAPQASFIPLLIEFKVLDIFVKSSILFSNSINFSFVLSGASFIALFSIPILNLKLELLIALSTFESIETLAISARVVSTSVKE